MRALFFVSALVLVSGLAVASCTPSEEPTPSPTAVETTASTTPVESPSPTPTTVDPQTANIQAAKQTVLDYTADFNAVSQAGFVDGEATMFRYWGTPELMETYGTYFQMQLAAGARSEGEVVIASITALEYIENPSSTSHHQVRLEFCEDTSASTNLNRDGSVVEKDLPLRFMYEALMQLQDDGRWTINALEGYPERIC